jgi:outer membrane cobalamin receptor
MRSFRPRRPALAGRTLLLGSLAASLLLFARATPVSAATIAGTVLDPDGRGVAGARLIVTSALGTVATSESDDRGAYEIPRLSAGTFRLIVVARGFQADAIDLTLGADDRREADVRLRLSAVVESIVVSASQIDLPMSQTASSVSIVTEADLRTRQATTVAEALRALPGVSVAKSGGQGALTSLFPRGGGSNYTLVLVDGMRVNSFGGGYDFGHLSAADVERIEIARGPGSAIFGSDAIGGVVQIVTKRGGRPVVRGLVEGGSQGTIRTTLDTSGSSGAWTWGGGAERAVSDGYGGTAANGERVTNDDDRLARVTGTLGWRQPGGADVLVSANHGRDERGFPGPFGADPSGFYSGVDRVSRGTNDTGQIGARVLHPWSPRVRQRLEAHFTDLSSEFASSFGPSASGSRRFDGRVQEDFVVTPAVGASAGVEFIRERGTSTFVAGQNGEAIPVERFVVGTFGEGRIAWRDRLFVTGGLRVEHLSRLELEADPFVFQPRPAFPKQTIDSVNPKVAASYLLTPSSLTRAATRIRASAGTGIRPPDVFEIAFTDNPGLQPERSRSFDAGVEQQLAGGLLSVAATAFFNRYDDLIVTIGRAIGGASRYRTDNVSNSRARGLELSADARVALGIALHAAYTFLDTEILSADGVQAAPAPFAVGDALVRRPRHQSAFHATLERPRFTAFAEVLQRGEALDLEPNRAGSTFVCPGYAVLNGGASVQAGKNFQVFVRALNLTDREYEETLGFPALRRSGIVGVRIAAGR